MTGYQCSACDSKSWHHGRPPLKWDVEEMAIKSHIITTFGMSCSVLLWQLLWTPPIRRPLGSSSPIATLVHAQQISYFQTRSHHAALDISVISPLHATSISGEVSTPGHAFHPYGSAWRCKEVDQQLEAISNIRKIGKALGLRTGLTTCSMQAIRHLFGRLAI